MEDSIIHSTEQLIRKQTSPKTNIPLYKNAVYATTTEYKPQDVIQSVCAQIKAIQMADTRIIKDSKKTSKEVVTKSHFMAVDNLPVYKASIPATNKFETQCVSDTQLIDIVERAEANLGMPQEFDTTFPQIVIKHCSNKVKEIPENIERDKEDKMIENWSNSADDCNSICVSKRKMLENTGISRESKITKIEIKALKKISYGTDALHTTEKFKKNIDQNRKHIPESKVSRNNENNSNNQRLLIENSEVLGNNIPEIKACNDIELPPNKEQKNENIVIQNFANSQEITIDTGQSVQRSPSPVLNMAPKKTKIPLPLIVSLKVFEKFEKIAMPIIEETLDKETARHVINSQILGRELILDGNTHLFDRNCSPILELESDELKLSLNSMDLPNNSNVIDLKNTKTQNVSCIEMLQDEILFSSDEEKELNKSVCDLPLTCALDTSFYEQTGLLDKTMFVGFQTASNKSIQICTNSFDKAKNILDHDGESAKEISLTELVEKLDKDNDNRPNNVLNIIQEESCRLEADNKTKAAKSNKNVKEYNKTFSEISHDVPKVLFNGFMTASNKKINMTSKAMARCKKVFRDIDINEDFSENPIKTVLAKEKIDQSLIEVKAKSDRHIEPQEIFDANINDELLLKEFESTEMSFEQGPENETEIKTDPEHQRKVGNSTSVACKALLNTLKASEYFSIMKTDNESYKIHSTLANAFGESENNKIGFKTASNNKFEDINMGTASNENLNLFSKTKNMEDTINFSMVGVKEPAFIGFKTASNKGIVISKEAMAKTKNVFQDIATKFSMEKDKKPDDIITNSDIEKISLNTEFIGFKTANNKDIKISHSALFKTQHIFKDLDRVSKPKNVFPERNKEKDKEDNIGIKSNKNIDLNKNTFGKYNSDMQESENNRNENTFEGFKTASNKDVKISEQALLKAHMLFKDIEFIDSNNEVLKKGKKHSNLSATSNDKGQKPMFIGFQTASEKPVDVSVDALVKSKKMCDDIDKKDDNSSSNQQDCEGFHTANNKSVEVNAEAFIESKKVLDDTKKQKGACGFKNLHDDKAYIHGQTSISNETLAQNVAFSPNDKDKSMFFGFQTASKRPVNVSADALAKSKRIFDYIDKVDDNALSKHKNDVFQGFQTAATNKSVEVSEEALNASKKALFGDRKENTDKNILSFNTASHRNIAISDDSLSKCYKWFENIDSSNIDVKGKQKQSFKGFETASHQKVLISEEALHKTKNIFDDVDSFGERKTANFKFQTACIKKDLVSRKPLSRSSKILNSILKDATDNNKCSIQTKLINNFEETTENIFKTIDKNRIKRQIKSDDKTVDKYLLKENVNTAECLINTQILNDFETTLYTEDFNETPRQNKRSASPILSCPRAKKRKKFETPYKASPNIAKKLEQIHKTVPKLEPVFKFREDYKKNKKYKLKDLVFEKNNTKTIDPYLLNFNLENILNIEFDDTRNELKNGVLSTDNIKKLFTENVNKKLIPEGWMENHLKLILWKLISYEIRFPDALSKVCTVKNVIDQLKYRYDKELYNAERPILRKILEKDDVSTNAIVFCVASIYVDNASVTSVTNTINIELLLTDGWYFIRATIDKMLSQLIYERKIVVGSKIITEGAELLNCEQGISPWEDTSSIRISISGNSTRPAPWDAPLGLRPAVLRSTLSSVRVEGGRVRRLGALVTRIYPTLYVEKFDDGSTVTRSERQEIIYQNKYETEREIMIEKIYEEVEKEFNNQESQADSCSSNDNRAMENGSQIARKMKNSGDPMEFRAQLTSSQIHKLQDHTNRQRDSYFQSIQERIRERIPQRNIVNLARVRIGDIIKRGDVHTVTKGMLSIWKPNEAVLEMLKEGSWIEVMNVVPTGIRNSEIQISAGKQSVFRTVKTKSDHHLDPYIQLLKRTTHKIKDLSQNPLKTTEYNEIDTVGFIFLVEPTKTDFDSTKHHFQNVYLADTDKNMICVNFWGGLKKMGFASVIDTCQVIFCGNLQKRSGNTSRNIPQYRATEFTIFTKSPKTDSARDEVEEFNRKLYGLDRRKLCEDCVTVKQNYSVIKCFDSESVSPYRFNNSAYNLAKSKLVIDTPKAVNVKAKSEDLDLSGLDFESTFKQPEEMSPKTLQRKKEVAARIAKLKKYGEPPPLSPINIINISKKAASSYKSPLLCDGVAKTNSVSKDHSQNVTTPTKIPDVKSTPNDVGSPILPMNRTFVKRVNPVKLNFSHNVQDGIDHFAEEFDGSPPLSLE